MPGKNYPSYGIFSPNPIIPKKELKNEEDDCAHYPGNVFTACLRRSARAGGQRACPDLLSKAMREVK